MSSHRIARAARPAEAFWRPLAQRAGYDASAAAQLLGVCLRSLERLCQRELGCTPSEWFQRERMATAAQLLATGRSAKCVALDLGYAHLSNFSRDFKRHHGRSPTVFAPRLALALPPHTAASV